MSRLRVLLAVVAAAGATGVGLTATEDRPTLPAAQNIDPSVTVPPTKLIAAVVLDAPTTLATTPPSTAAARRPTTTARPKPAGDHPDDENRKDTRPVPPPAGVPLGTAFTGVYAGSDIEGFARYEGQSTCDPTPKTGTLALRDLLLGRYPSTKSLGVSRDCGVGGQSEHKEGRAFDWGANINDSADVAAVNDFLNALFATDAAGNRYALARRMGIMYVIWNRQIWGVYNATDGWRPYDGASPHTDHVHISLSWEGARGQTSYWTNDVFEGLPDITKPKPPRPPRSTTTTTWRTRRTTTTTSTTLVDGPTTSTSISDGDDSSDDDSPPPTNCERRRRRGCDRR